VLLTPEEASDSDLVSSERILVGDFGSSDGAELATRHDSMKEEKETKKMNLATSPGGAVIGNGKGIESVMAVMKREFNRSRSYGPTMKAVHQAADDFVQEVKNQHFGEGIEIIEEKRPALPLRPRVDRAAPILERLARTPMLRKRPPNVWTIDEVPDTPERLFEAAWISLGHEPANAVNESRVQAIVPMAPHPNKKRSWWRS
jgi:hypothetical protein